MNRVALTRFATAVCVLVAAGAAASPAFAQAWALPVGVGSVSILYQTIANTGHLLADGSTLRGYDSASRSLQVEVDYALTDRWAVSVNVPYVAAKYQGPSPSFSGEPIDECRCWNHGLQDLNVTVRYNMLSGAFAITPSVSYGTPTHDYASYGEAVLGTNLKVLRLAIDVGQRFDRISPRLSVSGRYSYAVVERVLNLPNNRSNFSIAPGFAFTRRFSVGGTFSWQRSHGGLRSTEFSTDEQYAQYDRLVRDNNFRVGVAGSYSFPRVDVFVSYLFLAGGTDTHAGHAITAGLSVPFERRR